MTSGTLLVARVHYRTSMGSNDSPIIALGLFGEIAIPGRLRGLGLVARTELNKREFGMLDTIGERTLSNPFEYLSSQFEDAWKNAALGEAISYLQSRHLYSLRMEEAEAFELPLSLFKDGAPVMQLVRSHLIKTLSDLAAHDLIPLQKAPDLLAAALDPGVKDMMTPVPQVA